MMDKQTILESITNKAQWVILGGDLEQDDSLKVEVEQKPIPIERVVARLLSLNEEELKVVCDKVEGLEPKAWLVEEEKNE